jgi:hypothetical protein
MIEPDDAPLPPKDAARKAEDAPRWIMTPWRAKKILASRPATALDAANRKEWWQVGILDLANFFVKCWLANLLIAAVFGILGGAIWLLIFNAAK